MYFLFDFGGSPCLPGLVYWGVKPANPSQLLPSPSLTAPITTRQHCTSRSRHGRIRQGLERSHDVHMMRFSTDVVFFVLFLLVFFGSKVRKSWRFPKEQTYCLRQRAQVNALSGRNTCLKGCNSKLLTECQLHGICRISTNSDFHQILWRDIGVSIHNRTTAVKLSLSPDYGVHRDLVARLGPTTASASATF